MAIPPQENSAPAHDLAVPITSLESDVFAFQEVDHFLPRSKSRPQIRDIAESIGAHDWAMAPSLIGTPGESWRKLNNAEPEIINSRSIESELRHESFGIGIVSKIPVTSWHRLNVGNSPLGLPLIVPGDETGKGRPRFLYVKDEPRLALAAVLENGFTVVNTHLSFVPGFNLAQLRRVKKWALQIAQSTGTRAIVLGDLNLPKNLPIAGAKLVGSPWNSLVTQNTYPSWGGKIQFDYILSPDLAFGEYSVRNFAPTGVSDHLPIGIEIFG